MIKYRANLKGVGDLKVTDDKTVVIGIRVGLDAHENRKLQAVLESLKQCGIQHFIFLIADILQRYMLSLSNPKLKPSDLINLTDKLGNQWMSRNKDRIEATIGSDYEVVKWQNILAMASFKEWKQKLNNFCSSDESKEFDEVVENTIAQFIERYKRQEKADVSDNIILKKCARKHIIEESAGLVAFGLECKATYFAYPNQIISAFKFVQNEFLTDFEQGNAYLECLTIRIKRDKGNHAGCVGENKNSIFSHNQTLLTDDQTKVAIEGITRGFLSSEVADPERVRQLFSIILNGCSFSRSSVDSVDRAVMSPPNGMTPDATSMLRHQKT